MSVEHLNDEQREKLRGMLKESVGSLYRTEAEGSLRKEIATRAKEELDMKKGLFSKLVRTAFKNEAHILSHETTTILDLLEELGMYQHEDESKDDS